MAAGAGRGEGAEVAATHVRGVHAKKEFEATALDVRLITALQVLQVPPGVLCLCVARAIPPLACLFSFFLSLVRAVIICPASSHTALVSSPSLAVLHLPTSVICDL